jgi:hypothetical protein
MKKVLIITFVVIILIAISFIGGWFAHSGYIKPPKPYEKKVYVYEKSGHDIVVDNWYFDSSYGGFDAVAEGKGSAKFKFPRPDAWNINKYHHRIIVNAVLNFNRNDLQYGGELLYYYMLFDHVGPGGGVQVTANELMAWSGEIKIGVIFDIK